ncbi:MAG: hypothetical protein APF84_10415 [Gracilibacter sp. BRH_c7a]|nr:MAG: hypothetical protein APF84_10415 [Gracilibacter sp. BRH_c7a]
MSEWDPNLYLKFENERTQPVKDLIFHIKKENPGRIIDIGCGPGNSTNELKKRWGKAHIIGLDNSKTMLDKANSDYPYLDWVQYDARGDLSFLGKFDIVFSNAAIQWMADQKSLLEKLFAMLHDNGLLAVQLPNPTYMPINIAVLDTAEDERWQDRFKDIDDGLICNELSYYYNALSPLTKDIELWETYYYHVVPGHEAIIDWYKSTGMKPFLARLDESEKDEFAQEVLSKIQTEYKTQEDGNVLFPFRRLFFIAHK